MPTTDPVASLRPFFAPRSVAVIGASRNPLSIGYRLVDALVRTDFQGPVFPVNPHAAAITGLRAYPSVQDIPEPVDLALVAVPAEKVLAVVDDCAARGVPALVVISAGFAEVGGEGIRLQEQLLEKVRAAGMRMIGPNCLGLISTSPDTQLNATFAPLFPPPGHVAMSSDSGALGLALLATAARLGLGISSCVSVGNRADVSSNDLLQYWGEDERTHVILLYLESFGNPRRFARIVREVGRNKPIVAVKAGRTRAGRRAAGSHTAALAAREVAVDALFHQTGVLRAETLEEMFDLAAALDAQPLPPGNRVGILTNAGGPAILCADACEAGGLVLPELSQATRSRLAEFLPPTASLGNPVDMIASATPEDFSRATTILLESKEVDAVIVIHVLARVTDDPHVGNALVESVSRARVSQGANIPVLVCLMPDRGISTLGGDGHERLPCYLYPESAARVLSKAVAHAEWRRQPLGAIPSFADTDLARARATCQKVLQERGEAWLSTQEIRDVLDEAGLPLAAGGLARSAEEAVELARRLGFPVAVKLASQQIVHKTEVGGVHLHLGDEQGVRRAFEAIASFMSTQQATLDGVLVQPMITGGTEVMVGMTHDPVFGPLVAFGLGGIHVEILGDVCFRVTPLTDRDAHEMVRSVRAWRLFQGYRGHPPADVEAIEELLLRVSQLVEAVPELEELDLNPIFALPPGQGCKIVDARARVQGC